MTEFEKRLKRLATDAQKAKIKGDEIPSQLVFSLMNIIAARQFSEEADPSIESPVWSKRIISRYFVPNRRDPSQDVAIIYWPHVTTSTISVKSVDSRYHSSFFRRSPEIFEDKNEFPVMYHGLVNVKWGEYEAHDFLLEFRELCKDANLQIYRVAYALHSSIGAAGYINNRLEDKNG